MIKTILYYCAYGALTLLIAVALTGLGLMFALNMRAGLAYGIGALFLAVAVVMIGRAIKRSMKSCTTKRE